MLILFIIAGLISFIYLLINDVIRSGCRAPLNLGVIPLLAMFMKKSDLPSTTMVVERREGPVEWVSTLAHDRFSHFTPDWHVRHIGRIDMETLDWIKVEPPSDDFEAIYQLISAGFNYIIRSAAKQRPEFIEWWSELVTKLDFGAPAVAYSWSNPTNDFFAVFLYCFMVILVLTLFYMRILSRPVFMSSFMLAHILYAYFFLGPSAPFILSVFGLPVSSALVEFLLAVVSVLSLVSLFLIFIFEWAVVGHGAIPNFKAPLFRFVADGRSFFIPIVMLGVLHRANSVNFVGVVQHLLAMFLDGPAREAFQTFLFSEHSIKIAGVAVGPLSCWYIFMSILLLFIFFLPGQLLQSYQLEPAVFIRTPAQIKVRGLFEVWHRVASRVSDFGEFVKSKLPG